MSLTVGKAMQLLHELLEIDQARRGRRNALSNEQKLRRRDICRSLNEWALQRQRAKGGGAERREHARAAIQLRVQLSRGGQKMPAELDSLAVGGVSVMVGFEPKVGEVLGLRLVPEPPDNPLDLTGEVVWYDAVRKRLGLRFGAMGEEAQGLLERLVFGGLLSAKKR